MARQSFVPHLLLTTLIAIWAGSFVASKIAMQSVSPFALVASRFLLGALCLLPALLLGGRRAGPSTIGPGILAGLMLAIPYFLQMYGVRETTASMGGFVTGLIVLLVAVGGYFCFGARIGPRTVTGLGLGLAGIVMLCLTGDASEGPQQNTLRGILLQVGSAVGFAVHILLLSHYGRKLATVPFTFWQLAFTSALSTAATVAISGIDVDGGYDVTWSFELILAVAYLGVLATGVAIFVQAKVQHRIPPTHVAQLFALQPLFAAIAGALCLGDRLGAVEWAGGALIVAGVLVTSRERR